LRWEQRPYSSLTGGSVRSSPSPRLPTAGFGLVVGDIVGDRCPRFDGPSSAVTKICHPHSGEEARAMSDVILVGTIVAFFLVAATVVWACARITADTAIETESERKVLDGKPERT